MFYLPRSLRRIAMSDQDYKRVTGPLDVFSLVRRYRRFVVFLVLLGVMVIIMIHLFKREPDTSKRLHPPVVHLEALKSDYIDTFRKEISISTIPDDNTLNSMTGRQRERLYYSYLDNIDFLCHRKLRLGNLADGGWDVCDDAAYRPVTPCIVYSFGINFDYSFDDAVGRVYGCDVFAFDPSMNTDSHNRSEYVYFFDLGIGPRDETDAKGWRLRTLESLTTMLGHRGKTLDVVKMDVEGAEWPSIPEMATSGSLRSIRQLFVEFHADLQPDDTSLVDKLRAIRAIENAGFRRFHSHRNPACGKVSGAFPATVTVCYEVYFLNPGLARTTILP